MIYSVDGKELGRVRILYGEMQESHISGLPEKSRHEIVNVTENRVNSNL